RRPGGERVQEGGHARLDGPGRLQEIAPPQDVGGPLLAALEGQGGAALRPALPQRLDGLVLLSELRYGGAPVAEDGLCLGRGTLLGRDRQGGPDGGGDRVRRRGRGGADGQAEAAEVVVLVVVAVPAAVELLQVEVQGQLTLRLDGPLGDEHRLPRHVPAPGASVDAPRRLALPIDGEGDRPGDALLVRAVV